MIALVRARALGSGMKEIVIVCLAIDDGYRDGQYSRFPLTLPLKSAGALPARRTVIGSPHRVHFCPLNGRGTG
jgi:hypothetical protein